MAEKSVDKFFHHYYDRMQSDSGRIILYAIRCVTYIILTALLGLSALTKFAVV